MADNGNKIKVTVPNEVIMASAKNVGATIASLIDTLIEHKKFSARAAAEMVFGGINEGLSSMHEGATVEHFVNYINRPLLVVKACDSGIENVVRLVATTPSDISLGTATLCLHGVTNTLAGELILKGHSEEEIRDELTENFEEALNAVLANYDEIANGEYPNFRKRQEEYYHE